MTVGHRDGPEAAGQFERGRARIREVLVEDPSRLESVERAVRRVPLSAPTSRRRVRVRLAAPWKGFVRCEPVQSQRVLLQGARIRRRPVPGHRAHRREDDSILLIMPRSFPLEHPLDKAP
ncbi:hypothetical protein GCM10010350_00650 [Streptomyces galilaeus]|nr:hypothetical protein GCM10010350_00650 [Streptomyces galilaeus]